MFTVQVSVWLLKNEMLYKLKENKKAGQYPAFLDHSFTGIYSSTVIFPAVLCALNSGA